MNDSPQWCWEEQDEKAKVAELLADQTAFIAQLTPEQKDNLLQGLHGVIFGYRFYVAAKDEALGYKRMIQAARDEFEESAFEILGITG